MSRLGYYWRGFVSMGLGAGRNGRSEAKLLLHARARLSKYLDLDSRLRVLDIGCGQRCPAVSAFTAWGWDATGVDISRVGLDHSLSKYLGVLKTEGPGRLARSLVREAFFDRPFRKGLFGTLGVKIPRRVDVRLMSATNMEFADSTFDLVYSMAVFEHIDDVPAAVREVNRVLKPEGIGFIGLSLWPSLIGGHHPAWQNPDKYQPGDVPPWDHIRENRFPTPFYCNKYRERDYRKIFEQYTRILEWIDGPRVGESLVTDEILAELSDYTADELTKRSATAIIGKKLG